MLIFFEFECPNGDWQLITSEQAEDREEIQCEECGWTGCVRKGKLGEKSESEDFFSHLRG